MCKPARLSDGEQLRTFVCGACGKEYFRGKAMSWRQAKDDAEAQGWWFIRASTLQDKWRHYCSTKCANSRS